MPFELPSDRAGLPIPLEVVHTGLNVGAAGLGWEVPLSYIMRDASFAHRRPQDRPNQTPEARTRLVLVLSGQEKELVRRDDNTWVARDGALALTVRESPGVWRAYDENGWTYEFANQPLTGMWLLSAIHASGGASVRLSYEITGADAREISLRRIEYNTNAATGCAKNVISLTYGPPQSVSLGYTFVGDMLFGRYRLLAQVDVSARTRLGDSVVSVCNETPQRLQRYTFNYEQRTVDTQLPRLSSVVLTGRQGTPEANQPILVAAYEYGAAIGNDVARFEQTQRIALPSASNIASISTTVNDSSLPAQGSGQRYGMWQTLLDVTGDGRPDLTYKAGNKLRVAYNRPTDTGGTTIGVTGLSQPATAQLHDAVFQSGPMDVHSSTARRLRYDAGSANTVDVWRRAIDVNGDGRIDIVDASAEAKFWVVYLNMPGGSTGIVWKKRKISIQPLSQALAARGYELPSSGHLPISRSISALTSERLPLCLKFQSGSWRVMTNETVNGVIENTDPNTGLPVTVTLTWKCDGVGRLSAGPPAAQQECIQGRISDGQTWREGPGICPDENEAEKTFTQWDLTDLNGDGYPDLTFNGAAPQLRRNLDGPNGAFFSSPGGQPPEGATWIAPIPVSFGLAATEILAAYNIAGVRLDTTGTRPFSTPVVLRANGQGIGVGMWEGVPAQRDGADQQQQVGGLADINGDGLIDWVSRRTVYLGNGRGISGVSIALPGPMSVQVSNHEASCTTGQTYSSSLTAGLRDLTGDGIPDYVTRELWVGTGGGFAGPYQMAPAPDLSISTTIESCDGGPSTTARGLYDVDGDGKADFVRLENGELTVWQLASASSARRAPDAGRLTSVDNGYGAKTNITYRSAKEDSTTGHQVPYPEIVVSSVSVSGERNLGGSLSETRYAYGGAELMFDTASDLFRFPGYQRIVALRTYAGPANRAMGRATVADHWPGAPAGATSADERWKRARRAGRIRDIFVLRGTTNTNPWSLLTVDANSGSVIGVTHVEWEAKRFQGASTGLGLDCLEVINPYNWVASFTPSGIDTCRAHGFVYASSSETWYGAWAPPSTSNIQTRTRVLAVDDFGRTTSVQYENDLHRADDDLCLEASFAVPTGMFPRVLTAVSSRLESSCDRRVILSNDIFLYDGLAQGAVSEGRLTSHSVDQRATNNGDLIRQIRMFDATYDVAGNVERIETRRGGAVRTTTLEYDAFGIVTTRARTAASELTPMETSTAYDAASLSPIRVTDINGTQYGTEYDGFGRPVRTSVTPPGGELGVLSTLSYAGFAGASSGGRRIEVRAFADPVPPASLTTAPSQLSITYLDELGRQRFTMVALGSDYAVPAAIAVGARRYDELGRISFEADPFPARISATAAVVPIPDFDDQYGTTYHYENTGDVDCIIRGSGIQPLSQVTDESTERFPTCFNRTQLNHRDVREVRDATSLLPNSVYVGVVHRTFSSAIGRVLERSTERNGTRIESAAFTHDRLGQLTAITRYQNPAAQSAATRTLRHMDSLGNMIQLDEPQTSRRYYDYSEWGEPTEIRWQDGAIVRRIISQYDALGRITSNVESNNGVIDPETANGFGYDTPRTSERFSPTFTLGRLATAVSPTTSVSFSYDAFGRVDGRIFSDDERGLYLEKSAYHADGRLSLLELNLPDNAFAREILKYNYDSARRLRTVTFDDPTGNRDLYNARKIDALGRVREAAYGGVLERHADYPDTGRQLLRAAEVRSTQGSRELHFLRYDALGREVDRTENRNGQAGPMRRRLYDYLGRLALSGDSAGTTLSNTWGVQYDPLGNVQKLNNVSGALDATLRYGLPDLDRVCAIHYGDTPAPGGGCNVAYDAAGNTTRKPTRADPITLSYFNFGGVRTISNGLRQAKFSYDAFGEVHKVDVPGGPELGGRQDRRYGSLIERRTIISEGSPTSIIVRNIPGPNGLIASRKGPGADWIFGFADIRGSRFFADETGAFVQDIDYQPFGEPVSTGASVGTRDYASYQWNQGDVLSSFGLVHLGARLYDPTIGRFLSRDPLVVPRGGSTTNAYAFARNDPVNAADPAGLDDDLDDELDHIETWTDRVGGAFDLIDIWVGPTAGHGLYWSDKMTDVVRLSSWSRGGALSLAGDFSNGLGKGADALGIGIAFVQAVRDPTLKNNLGVVRQASEAVLSRTGIGLAFVWGMKGVEAGAYELIDYVIARRLARENRKLTRMQERHLQRKSYEEDVNQRRRVEDELVETWNCNDPSMRASLCADMLSSPGPAPDPSTLPLVIPSELLLKERVSRPVKPTPPRVSRPGGGSGGGSDPVIIGVPGGCQPGQCDRPN